MSDFLGKGRNTALRTHLIPLAVSHQIESRLKSVFSPWEYHLLVLQLSGASYVKARRNSAFPRNLVPTGKIFFFPARAGISIEFDSEVESLHMHIHTKIMDEVGAGFGLSPNMQILNRITGEYDELLEQLVVEAWRATEQANIYSSVYTDQLARLISSRLLWRITTSRDYENDGGLSDRRLRNIEEFIENHLSQNISLSDLSKLAHCSLSHFTRQFKISTGTTPYQYILQKRIEHSKRLLRYSSQPIAEISLECGFTHQEHLTHAFKRLTGMTPAKYRRLSRNGDSHFI